ncbi:PAC2 family protein [Candidatus Woesearchaeota archaeon]|nr:PAC2 family protein [Candidatus Woesearchaeota archaeon]
MKSASPRWQIQCFEKKMPALKKPILLVGLPGIGNVGKIVVDFLIDELKAKKLYQFYSYTFPQTVFVTEKNLIELPSIEVYYKKGSGKSPDLILLSGDVQPTEQEACYEFCDMILDMFQEMKGKEIMTIGGIGLQEVADVPKVFCTGNMQSIVDSYKKGTTVNPNLYGVVGPIVGVSGVLLGLSLSRKIPAICFLAETLAMPYYVGIKGSKEILLVLQKKLNLSFDVNKLEKEIKEFEKEIIQTAQQMMDEMQKQGAVGQNPQSYIG